MIEDPLHKSSLFIDIGRKLMEIGQIIQAVETIQLLKDPAVESEFLLEVVSHVKKRGDFQEARWVANNIPDLEIKRKILTILP